MSDQSNMLQLFGDGSQKEIMPSTHQPAPTVLKVPFRNWQYAWDYDELDGDCVVDMDAERIVAYAQSQEEGEFIALGPQMFNALHKIVSAFQAGEDGKQIGSATIQVQAKLNLENECRNAAQLLQQIPGWNFNL